MTRRSILVTGAGSGIGEGVAIGLAREGHHVIAGVQISPQVTALREKCKSQGLPNVIVRKLDILDPIDVEAALKLDFDILLNHAGIGEAGPVSEIPIELVRRNYETNVFAPLHLSQRVVKKWIDAGVRGKIVFTSSEVGLFTPEGFGCYASTKHALEAIAEAFSQEVSRHGIKVQVINPGPFATGFNETMADTAFQWLDDNVNFTKRADLRKIFEADLKTEYPPSEAINAMIKIVPEDAGLFRNVIPKSGIETIKRLQEAAWTARI